MVHDDFTKGEANQVLPFTANAPPQRRDDGHLGAIMSTAKASTDKLTRQSAEFALELTYIQRSLIIG